MAGRLLELGQSEKALCALRSADESSAILPGALSGLPLQISVPALSGRIHHYI